MARMALDREGRARFDEERFKGVRESLRILSEAGKAFNDAWKAAKQGIKGAETPEEDWTLTAAVLEDKPGEPIVVAYLTFGTVTKDTTCSDT